MSVKKVLPKNTPQNLAGFSPEAFFFTSLKIDLILPAIESELILQLVFSIPPQVFVCLVRACVCLCVCVCGFMLQHLHPTCTGAAAQQLIISKPVLMVSPLIGSKLVVSASLAEVFKKGYR